MTNAIVNNRYTKPAFTVDEHGIYSTMRQDKDWKVSVDSNLPSERAVTIMGYRRQYKTAGIANFVSRYLEPELARIKKSLERRGFTVAQQIVDKEGKNYCFDVSKDGVLSNTLFVAHYDTVDSDLIRERKLQAEGSLADADLYKAVHIVNGVAMLKDKDAPNAATCLGADDGAGLAVMLWLMEQGVLGGYCFTTGEECGGIGAGNITQHAQPFLKQYTHAIEIDRRGFSEVIISQGMGDCASEEFGKWLVQQLTDGEFAFAPSELGSYTDVATFAEIIPECVNLAAGYINAHSQAEQVYLPYLDFLGEKLKGIDFTQAPLKRTAGDFGFDKTRYRDWTQYNSNSWYGDLSAKDSYAVEYLSDDDLRRLLAFCVNDHSFFEYVLAGNIQTKDDLNILCNDYYGNDFDEIVL